jgi:hypothetical protein
MGRRSEFLQKNRLKPKFNGDHDLIAEIMNSLNWQIDLPIWRVTISDLRQAGGTLATLLQKS